MLDKERLIDDLKSIHKDIVKIYKDIFEYKYINNEHFYKLISNEYKKDNRNTEKEKEVWNEQYFHRSAYTLINKILFIRICEDKGFMLNEEDKVMGEELNPTAGQKLTIIGLQKWSNLISNYSLSELINFAFRDMNRTYYNISLYKEDKYDWLIPDNRDVEKLFDEEDSISNRLFSDFESLVKNIIEVLDTSRYNFDDSSGNVLGDVYENFMDRGTRKALGQFYTPDFVIDYILDETVETIDVIENPFVKILDPSCGSGHFLIKAYDRLRLKFEESLEVLKGKFKNKEYTVKHGNSTETVTGEEYWSERYLHYHILKHCIYGADIDAFALQLTTINLLLKDLENFITDELNIIECDSLIKWETDYNWKDIKEKMNNGDLFLSIDDSENLLSWDEAERIVKNGEFWSNKFDFIIGNPPFISYYGRRSKGLETSKLRYYQNTYQFITEKKLDGKYSTTMFFLERSLDRLKENSCSMLVLDISFFDLPYRYIRKFILENAIIEKMVFNISDFDEVASSQIIIKIQKKIEQKEKGVTEWLKYEDGRFNSIDKVKQNTYLQLRNYDITPPLESNIRNIILKLEGYEKLNYYLPGKLLRTCMSLGGHDDEFTVNPKTTTTNDHIFLYLRGARGVKERYSVPKSNVYLRYDTELRDKINRHYRKDAYNEQRRQPKAIGLGSLESFLKPKLFIRQSAERIVATYTEEKFAANTSLYIVNESDENNTANVSIKYLLGVLNSTLISFYAQVKQIIKTAGGKQPQIMRKDLLRIPIPYNSKLENSVINNVNDLLSLREKVETNNFNLQNDTFKDSKDIIQGYIEYKYKISNLEKRFYITEFVLNHTMNNLCNLTIEEERYIEKYVWQRIPLEKQFLFNLEEKSLFNVSDFEKELDLNFIEEKLTNISPGYLLENKSKTDKEIAEELNCEPFTIFQVRYKMYKNSLNLDFINLEELFEQIYNFIEIQIIDLLQSELKYQSIDQLELLLNNKIRLLDVLIRVLRIEDTTINSRKIIRDCISDNKITYNRFLSERRKGKKIYSTIIQYEKDILGLVEWDDDIHRKFFVDFINYLTTSSDESTEQSNKIVSNGINKTKKKAEEALKNLHQLDFKDKEDYLEILTEKVKKAFD